MDSSCHHLTVDNVKMIRPERKSENENQLVCYSQTVISGIGYLPSVQVVDLELYILRRVLWQHVRTHING